MLKLKLLKLFGIHKYYKDENISSKDIWKSYKNGVYLILTDGSVLHYNKLGYRIIYKLKELDYIDNLIYDSNYAFEYNEGVLEKTKLPKSRIVKSMNNYILTENGNLYTRDRKTNRYVVKYVNIKDFFSTIVITNDNAVINLKNKRVIHKFIGIVKFMYDIEYFYVLCDDFKLYQIQYNTYMLPTVYENVSDIYYIKNKQGKSRVKIKYMRKGDN